MAKLSSAKANMLAGPAPKARSGLNSGLDVLELLAAAGGGMSLSEIARELGMSKSGVHGLLSILARRGFVARDEAGDYRLGIRAWEVGSATPVVALSRLAAPHMVALMQETREGVILGVLRGAEVVYGHLVEAPQAVRVHASVGERIPAHCTSTGLALLAACDDAQLEALLLPRLPAVTEATITGREELLRELGLVRRRGYAMNHGGWRSDVAGVAAVIRDRRGAAQGALCVSAPRYRTTAAWFARVIPALLTAVARVSGELGAPGQRMERGRGEAA